jgi:hypothetical protein
VIGDGGRSEIRAEREWIMTYRMRKAAPTKASPVEVHCLDPRHQELLRVRQGP